MTLKSTHSHPQARPPRCQPVFATEDPFLFGLQCRAKKVHVSDTSNSLASLTLERVTLRLVSFINDV